jgi:virulence factor Mce-like protein
MRVELRRARRPALVVAAGLVAAVASAAVLLSHLSGGTPFATTTTIRVAVDDAKGVVPSEDEVRWAGVVVGRISAAKLDGDRAVLTAQLNGGQARPLYRNARVRLRPQTALNDMYLDIEDPGTPAAGKLAPGAVLGAARTRTPVDIAEVLNVFSGGVRDRLKQALDELAVGLPDGGAELRSAFAQAVPLLEVTHRLGGAIARRRQMTRRLVANVRVIMDELATRDATITRLVGAAGSTFDELGARRVALDRVLRELPPTLGQMRSSFSQLQGTLADTRPALATLRPAVRALPSGLRALDSLDANARPALRALQPAVIALRPLARDLAPTASALDAAFARLEPELPAVERITEKISRCERPVDKFFAYTTSTFKFGNRGNLTASPRGLLATTTADATNGTDPNMVGAVGCADGKAPR